MAKKVLAIDNKFDIIRLNMDYLMEVWEEGKIPVKKSPKGATFRDLTLDPEEYGILWFISSDYANLLKDNNYEKFVFEDHKRVVGLTSDRTLPLEQVLEQGKELTEKLKLETPDQLYIKLKVYPDLSIGETISKVKKELPLLGRVQLDFNGSGFTIPKAVSVASKANAIGKKNGLSVNSCSFAAFNEKNRWIGNEPCISAFSMQRLLDTAMVKRPDTFNEGDCGCHKYVNLTGSGEIFDPAVHKMARTKAKSRSGY